MMATQVIDQKQQILGPSALSKIVNNESHGVSLKEKNEKDEPDINRNKENSDEFIKCSAVSTLERNIPDFDYSHLIKELRDRMLEEMNANPGVYRPEDVEKFKNDQWYVERYLLRQHLDVDLAFEMFCKSMRVKYENLFWARREDFPAEFYQVGGLFAYEPDRKGNQMLYIRVKIHKKIPEIQGVFHFFLHYNIEYLDQLANGRGLSIVFDCSGGGLANADADILLFLTTTLMKYFPKGLSYLLVHELPWILKPLWYLAKAWIPEEYRELVKFSNSRTIYEYVDKENLPDFLGGTCQRDYRAAPENCTTLEQAAKLWGIEKSIVERVLQKFAEYLPKESLEHFKDTSDQVVEGDSDEENRPNKS